MNKEEWLKELKKRQEKHYDNIKNYKINNKSNLKIINTKKLDWKPCEHDKCSLCHGTGLNIKGEPCIHYINCSCPRCYIT